ncbi:MAG: carboxymuconolactone decarboxylase family protein [Nitrososphaerota archaeon]|nr:carboxymuconolactone decarboxylase family protein [Nitrososphaerota archaeon]MDG7024925.1 carboxymuconolactone decarboxylase family protein [Nitrososphaerota archaeon]
MTASRSRNLEEPFLAPIEEPKDPVLRQIFAAQKAYLGKVITPSKVHSARLPPAFAQFYGKIGELDRELGLSPEMALLIRGQVARLNVCLFCMDSERAAAIQRSMNQAKFDALDEYDVSPVFTDAERAALDYVTRLTKDKKVDPGVFDRVARYYSEREICEMVYLVASEHVYNMTNIGLNIHSDMLCDLAKKRRYEQTEKA